MNCLKGTKINNLLKIWPQSTIATSSWLETLGISHQLRAIYEQSAWIKRIGHGAFMKDGDHVSWEGALYALQQYLQLPIHVAAKTALEFQGAAHFIQSGKGQSVILFGAPLAKLPSWFKKHDWQKKIHFITTNLFFKADSIGLVEKKISSISLRISSRERALFELLHLIPHEQSIDEALIIFESLRTLRPELLQELLHHCFSIKVKRLFLYFAEVTNQPWLEDLDLSRIDLGKGKRVIAGGGVFNSKYNISLPKLSSTEEQTLKGT